ncbi:2-dehydropantoate 2-reductase [Blautia sp. 2744]|uniref:2-dehydropantoate 2-reductase n=1 Tax=Blautia intestinalis TaxID=2763028 RepID=A0ABR7I466_9FIRM|nr:2-dehydropantoate 2-reductase [Blautia intestinalis]MBC5741300.1 2-dehydropantoate 2-reductase [Blautia intestinalis]RHD30075.1 2-dehydropantoate 2-reductase [Blautia obeum]
MKYAIIGAGGTGGCLGFFLEKAGKDVTLIARGKHLEAIRKNGLTIQKLWDESRETLPVKACTAEEYKETPDVILICVKGYSMDETVPAIKKIAGKETVVIPILNIYGTGGRLQKKLPELTVPDGCIYVSANILEPGVILQHGKILRVVFGARKPEEETEKMREVAKDMASDEMEVVLSENIRRDAMVKFSYVSPIGAAGLYCNAVAADFQREGEQREMFKALIREIVALSHAMGIEFEEDLVERNLKILASLSPEATTSMQRDVMEGKRSEMDGMVYEVVRMGREYKVSMPQYEKAAACFREQGIL